MICYQIYPHDCNHYMRTRYSDGAALALPAVEPRLETTERGVKCETIAPIISHPPSPPNTVLPHLSPHSSDCLSSLTPTNTPIYYIKMVSSPCGLILYLQIYLFILRIYHTVNRLRSFPSSCHLDILSSGHLVIGHLVISSSCHPVISSSCHPSSFHPSSVILSSIICHPVIHHLSSCHPVIRHPSSVIRHPSSCQPVILSLCQSSCHPITLSSW